MTDHVKSRVLIHSLCTVLVCSTTLSPTVMIKPHLKKKKHTVLTMGQVCVCHSASLEVRREHLRVEKKQPEIPSLVVKSVNIVPQCCVLQLFTFQVTFTIK